MKIVDEAKKRIEEILEGKEDEKIMKGNKNAPKTEESKREEKKEVKTYKIRINDMEIEVPEGFEVVVTEKGTVIRESESGRIIEVTKEILKQLKAIREEGLDVGGAVLAL